MMRHLAFLIPLLAFVSSQAIAGGSQPATPAGTNGQPQYNNNGVFGGFTFSGDCTFVASTGVITCTKTGGVSFAPSATTDTTNAANIASGTLGAARLPNPSATTLGGVESIASVSHQFLTGLSTAGVPSQAQPAFTDISGTAQVAQGGTGVTAAQGNGSKVQLSTGTTTTNDCVKFDVNGNTVDAGAACGSGGTGTVTSASVVSANGLAGTVANATTTPAFTLSTSVTGMVKGNGTALSAATAGTDYSAGTSGNATGIVKSTTGTGALTTAVAGDFPTLNQNTTGSAASFTGSLTGDVTGTQGATTVGKINGTSLSGLSTGILKNTTSTGVPSIAVAGTDYQAPISIPLGTGFTITQGTANASPLTGSSSLFAQTFPNAYTGSHTVTASESAGLDICNSSSALTMTLPQAGTTGFLSGTSYSFLNINTGVCTISTTTSVLNGMPLTSSNIPLSQYGFATCVSDGTNWNCAGSEAGSGAVTSVSNSDSTLTVTPTTGAVVASLNLAHANTWTKGQTVTPATVSISTATFTPDFSASNNFNITLVHASCPCTLANPTNIVAGQSGVIVINQSATGSDLVSTYGGDWKFAAATAPTLSTAASAPDVFSYYVIDSTHIALTPGILNVH